MVPSSRALPLVPDALLIVIMAKRRFEQPKSHDHHLPARVFTPLWALKGLRSV